MFVPSRFTMVIITFRLIDTFEVPYGLAYEQDYSPVIITFRLIDTFEVPNTYVYLGKSKIAS